MRRGEDVAGDRRIAGGNLRKGGLCRAERRVPLLGIGELPEAISVRGAMPCGEEGTLRGIGELPEAISVRGAMPPFNKIVAIFWGVFIVR